MMEKKLQMSEKRIVYISNLRIFACLGVILCHVAAMDWFDNIWDRSWIIMTIYNVCSRFCVPVFVMISGALFLNPEKEIRLKKLYLSNILKLCIFLMFWGIFYQIYYLVVFADMPIPAAVIQGGYNVLTGDTQTHLWYIYMLIGLYLIVPVLKPCIDHLKKRQIEYFLILWMILNVLTVTISVINIPLLQIISMYIGRFSVNIVEGYVGYFVLGHYLNAYEIPEKIRKICYAAGVAAVMACSVLTVLYSRSINSPSELFMDYRNIFVALWSISIFLFFQKHFNQLQTKWLDWIAKCTMGIYGVHVFFIFEMRRREIDTTIFNNIVSIPFLVIVIFLCSLLVVSLIRLIPLFRKWIT